MAKCEKCGTPFKSPALGGLCPRCLMADALGATDAPKAGDTSRMTNPYFARTFGDYEVLAEVARGGMGVIYKARQRSLGRIVAIKVLSSGEFASPEYVRRFRAEAEAAARLQHPNIVAVHEVGQQDGVRFFSMEFVDGPNLAQFQAGRALPPARAAAILKPLAEAIHYAHQKGILHRDLKPSNVLIDPFGEPRITDFGLAKEMGGDSDLTAVGQVLGTPGYLPPEQADTSHGPLTPAADVYSLGAILYYMLTARAPFVAGSLRETLRQMLASDPVPPRALNPEVPRDLETICLKCLQRSPARRYPTAQALAEDLRRFMADEPIIARPATVVDDLLRWCRRRPALAAVWVLAVTLAVGASLAAGGLARARTRTETALARSQQAEAARREQVRAARLAEARAVRRTTVPGRREQALAALREAAAIRPGADLRTEALAALMLADVRPAATWDLQSPVLLHFNFDPAGAQALVATGDDSGLQRDAPALRAWGTTNGGPTLARGTNEDAIGPWRFSPDGKVVAVRCQDATVRLWRTGETAPYAVITNRPLPDADSPTQPHNDDYDFSPDGRLLAVGLPGAGVALHRVADGGEVVRRETGLGFSKVRIAPDGRYLAATRTLDTTNRTVWLFQMPKLEPAGTLTLREPPNHLAWSADGRVLGVSADDNTVSLYNVDHQRVVRTLACPALGDAEFAFLGGDTLLFFRGVSSTLHVVNTATGGGELVLNHVGPSEVVAARGGAFLVVPSLEGVVTRWAVQPPVGFHTVPPPRPAGYEFGINQCCLDFSPDGRWVVSSHGRFLLLRGLADGRFLAEATEDIPGIELSAAQFVDGGRAVVLSSLRHGLRRRAIEVDAAGEPRFGPATVLDPEPGWVMVDALPGGRAIALLNRGDGMVKIVGYADGKLRPLGRWEHPKAYSVALSPDGASALVNCSVTRAGETGFRMGVHRVADGSLLRELPGVPSCDTAWSADGRYAMTSNGQKRSTLWRTSDWQPTAYIDGALGGESTTFALAPDGQYAAVNRDEEVVLLATATGAELARLPIPEGSGTCSAIRFLPDGKRFAILWRDGRIDVVEPSALQAALQPYGLGW